YETESESPPATYRRVSAPKDSKHLWKGNLPLGVDPGIQVLHVRATDVNGQWHRAERIVRIVQ
ncbi:MAG: metallophosphoesterase, partial [Verrucomicrobiota bacterium]